MKTLLEKVKDDYAGEQCRDSWEDFITWKDLCHTPIMSMQYHYDEVAKRYATEYAKEALKNASDNSLLIDSSMNINCKSGHGLKVDKQSILSEDNLPKH